MGGSHCGSRINSLALAVVAEEHFKHVDHAPTLVVGCSFEGKLEGWRNAQVKRVAFDVVESHVISPASVCAFAVF